MNCPKCNKDLELKIPRNSSKGLKGVKIICECGYKSECIDWNEYIYIQMERNKIKILFYRRIKSYELIRTLHKRSPFS